MAALSPRSQFTIQLSRDSSAATVPSEPGETQGCMRLAGGSTGSGTWTVTVLVGECAQDAVRQLSVKTSSNLRVILTFLLHGGA